MRIPTATLLSLSPALLLLPAVAGCAAYRPDLTCPKQGGPSWTEVASPHFVVQTDLPEKRSREIVAELELSRAALTSVLGAPSDDAAAAIEVIVFERDRDYEAATRDLDSAGLYFSKLPSDVEEQRVVVARGGLDEPTRFLLQHELVHEIVRRRTARLPWWLDEGLADTFATVQVEGNTVLVGEPRAGGDFWENAYEHSSYAPRLWKHWFPVDEAPKLAFLLHTNRSFVSGSGRQSLYYAAARKLVHVLRGDVEPSFKPRFSAMLSALMSGTAGAEAFAKAYEGVSTDSLEGAYDKYLLDHREYIETLLFTPPPPAPVKARTLPEAEVHALWARLRSQDSQGAVEEELARGLSESPGDPALLYVKVASRLRSNPKTLSEADVQALRRADPYNPHYLMLQIESRFLQMKGRDATSFTSDERSEMAALVNLLTRVATSPRQRSVSEAFFAADGQIEAARARGEAIVKANPSCGICLQIHAEVLLSAGAAEGALDAAERALALLPEGQSDAHLKDLIKRAKAAEKEPAPRSPPTPR